MMAPMAPIADGALSALADAGQGLDSRAADHRLVLACRTAGAVAMTEIPLVMFAAIVLGAATPLVVAGVLCPQVWP